MPSVSSVLFATASPLIVSNISTTDLVLDYCHIADNQSSARDSFALICAGPAGRIPRHHGPICDVPRGTVRPLIPHRYEVFLANHFLAHPGIRATRTLLSARMVWRRMAFDMASWCRDCQDCSHAKVTAQPAARIRP